MAAEEHFFSSAAEADFQSLYNRYGDLIYGKVDRAISKLLQHPELAPIYEDPIRRLVIRGTPVGLFYGIHGRRIAIVALLDLRQNPEGILRRLKE